MAASRAKQRERPAPPPTTAPELAPVAVDCNID